MRAGRKAARIVGEKDPHSKEDEPMAEVQAQDPEKPPIRDQVQPDFPWVHVIIAASLGLAAILGGVIAGLLVRA